MESPLREAIDTFVAVTGASEDVARWILQDYNGDVNQAVNAYFSERERTNVKVPHSNSNVDESVNINFGAAPYRPFRRSAIFESIFNLRQRFQDLIRDKGFPDYTVHEPGVSHPRHQREILIDEESSHPAAPRIEEVTGDINEYHPPIEGIVTTDDFDDTLESPSVKYDKVGNSSSLSPEPSDPGIEVISDSEIEEVMIKVALEESKRGLEEHQAVHLSNEHLSEDELELGQAISMSLETEGKERLLSDHAMQSSLDGAFSPSRLFQNEHEDPGTTSTGRLKTCRRSQ